MPSIDPESDVRSADGPAWCLDWTLDAATIEDAPVDIERTADDAERAALAEALALLSVDALAVTGSVRPRGAGRFVLDGRIAATIRQACVVTLDPVTQAIDEPLAAEFWPAAQITPETRPEVEITDTDTPEPLDGTRVPLGRLVYETLATAIDPYPRAAGATLEIPEPDASARDTPFAVLARLKDKTRDGKA